MGTSRSRVHTPSVRSLVNGNAALCARLVLDVGPNSAIRSASRSSTSGHGKLLDPVSASRPSANNTRSGLCGERRPSCWCCRSEDSRSRIRASGASSATADHRPRAPWSPVVGVVRAVTETDEAGAGAECWIRDGLVPIGLPTPAPAPEEQARSIGGPHVHSRRADRPGARARAAGTCPAAVHTHAESIRAGAVRPGAAVRRAGAHRLRPAHGADDARSAAGSGGQGPQHRGGPGPDHSSPSASTRSTTTSSRTRR